MAGECTERHAVEILARQLETLPLATWATVESLADAAPEFEKVGDGRYELVGEWASISLEDLEDLESDVWEAFEARGLYVMREHDCGFSLRERVGPGRGFDCSRISLFSLSSWPVLSLRGDDFRLSDGVLERTSRESGVSGSAGLSVAMDAERGEALGRLLAESRVPEWGREYDSRDDGLVVHDGWEWSLLVVFEDGRVFESGGSNAWPEGFGTLWNGLLGLVGAGGEWERPLQQARGGSWPSSRPAQTMGSRAGGEETR